VNVGDGAGFLGALLPHATAATTEHAPKGTSTAAATEELGKQIFSGHATSACTALLEPFLAILIVYVPLLRVGENLVCV